MSLIMAASDVITKMYYKNRIAEILPPLNWYEEQVARMSLEHKEAAARGDDFSVLQADIIKARYAQFMWELRRDLARAIKRLNELERGVL